MRNIKELLFNAKKFLIKHKLLSICTGTIVIVLCIFSVYYLNSKTSINYITQAIKKGNINVGVSGTGQVSSSRDVALSSSVSGELLIVNFKSGESVKKGDVIFRIDNTDALKAIRNAELSLETAKLSYEKTMEPVDELTLLQAENSLTQAKESKTQSQTNLKKSYDDGYTSVANAFLDLPTVISGLKDILYKNTFSQVQGNADYYADSVRQYNSNYTQYKDDAINKYLLARSAYDANFNSYKSSSRYSLDIEIETLITETYNTTKLLSDAVKSANNLIQFYKDTLIAYDCSPSAVADTHLSSLNSYTSKTNSNLSSLLSIKQSIYNYESALISADRSIAEKQASLEKTKEGADELEIRTQKLSIQQKENDLADAKSSLADYIIKAPFDGVLASISAIKGDNINSGTSLGSIITNQRIVTVTLNETDIANVELGQKVSITFDSLDELLIDGEVSEIDTVGAVSQGVVSYNVKINFDSDDKRIKSGMSVSANIIEESVSDVLVVPSSAVKTQRGLSYVSILKNGQPENKKVELGLSDDSYTEIRTGLAGGDLIITQIVSSSKTSTKKTTTTTTNSKTNTMTGPGGGGEVMMFRGM